MPTTENDVKSFLNEFKVKMGIWQILFRTDRDKNLQTLADLEITQSAARAIIEKLDVVDFSEGPLEEKMHGIGSMWVFGKEVKKKEIYIKVAMGHEKLPVICVSFHVASKKMSYPFKNI